MASIKTVTVSGTFPELSASHYQQSGKGEGSSLKVAARRAIDDMLAKPHVRGRRLRSFKVQFWVEDVHPDRGII